MNKKKIQSYLIGALFLLFIYNFWIVEMEHFYITFFVFVL